MSYPRHIAYSSYLPQFVPNGAMATHKTSRANLSQHRVRTYTAHALILFNVYGIPLSSGIWLEYYFTSLLPLSSLVVISTVFGAQLACLGGAVGPAAWLYTRWPKCWRLHMLFGLLCVCGAWLALLIIENELWTIVLCHGILTGTGLGILGTISTLTLSTHYRHHLGVTSTQCVAAGFTGAIVYTISTWLCVRTDSIKMAYGTTSAVQTGTLLLAIFLAAPHPSPSTPHPPSQQSHPAHRPPRPVAALTCLLMTPTLLAPIYLPLLLTRQPSPHRADPASYVLLALSCGALLPCILIPRTLALRLALPTLFAASALAAGIAMVPMVWMRGLSVAVPCGVVFGAGFGGVGLLWVRIWAGFGGRGGEVRGRWVCVGMAVAGLGAGGGVVGAAAVLERWEGGVEMVLGAVAGCAVLGGLVVWAGVAVHGQGRRMLRRRG
ncbi:hypothetical protein EJ07DRAFT_152557 [Lizonia empirigonia]|nr:hypothetical protein EJ07DRAFT_152557 [Lizonia empirigonia]